MGWSKEEVLQVGEWVGTSVQPVLQYSGALVVFPFPQNKKEVLRAGRSRCNTTQQTHQPNNELDLQCWDAIYSVNRQEE
jgi:hypothetical protein